LDFFNDFAFVEVLVHQLLSFLFVQLDFGFGDFQLIFLVCFVVDVVRCAHHLVVHSVADLLVVDLEFDGVFVNLAAFDVVVVDELFYFAFPVEFDVDGFPLFFSYVEVLDLEFHVDHVVLLDGGEFGFDKDLHFVAQFALGLLAPDVHAILLLTVFLVELDHHNLVRQVLVLL